MQLKDTKKSYDYFSGKASDIARYIAFAGFAIIWALKSEFIIKNTPQELIYAIGLLTIAITADLLQYVSGTIIWGIYNRKKERVYQLDEKKVFYAPKYINWPTIIFFWLKIIVLISAYILLFLSIIKLPDII